jgi:hypothetical protein
MMDPTLFTMQRGRDNLKWPSSLYSDIPKRCARPIFEVKFLSLGRSEVAIWSCVHTLFDLGHRVESIYYRWYEMRTMSMTGIQRFWTCACEAQLITFLVCSSIMRRRRWRGPKATLPL